MQSVTDGGFGTVRTLVQSCLATYSTRHHLIQPDLEAVFQGDNGATRRIPATRIPPRLPTSTLPQRAAKTGGKVRSFGSDSQSRNRCRPWSSLNSGVDIQFDCRTGSALSPNSPRLDHIQFAVLALTVKTSQFTGQSSPIL